MFQTKQGMSNLWSGICSQNEVIKAGSAVALGNGRTTLFWDHPWLDGESLIEKALSPVPINMLRDSVADMWDEEHGWKWESFSEFLTQLELQKISSYSLSTDTDIPDALYWRGSISGKFTIKSALGFMREVDEAEHDVAPIWRVIWRLPVQQRIKMFIWLAAHGRLLTNKSRVHRNMGVDPMCPRCSESEEDIDHLLRSCRSSNFFWNQVAGPAGISSFYTCSIKDWLELNASNSFPQSHDNWALEFSITCWWIWKWRNHVVFGRDSEIPNRVYEFLARQYAAAKHAFDRYSILMPRAGQGSREVFIRWESPPHGWIKLNTDGASRGNPGFTGSGGVFRDETGNFLSAYFINAGHCPSMRAELIALGLKEAKRLGYTRSLINMDNTACISLIKAESLVTSSLREIVAKCRELFSNFVGDIRIDHCYQEGNRAADWLMNRGVVENSRSMIVLNAPLPEMISILRDDVIRVSLPRMLNT